MKVIINRLISNGYLDTKYSFNNLYTFIKEFILCMTQKLVYECYSSGINEFKNKIKELLNRYSIQ